MHLFTYGSLMFSEVWQSVVRRKYCTAKAILLGYERRAVKGVSYPCIIPSAAQQVSGIVYLDVRDDDLETLDAFEADEYDRVIVQCQLPDGKRIEAFAYVWNERFHELVDGQWDAEWFRREGMQRFLNRHGSSEDFD